MVKDFNFKPIQQPIEQLIMRLNRGGGYIFVRTRPGNTEATVRELGKISLKLNPAYPFDFSFLDEDLLNLYKSEQRIGSLFNVFAILAIFISCLGLYGLSAFIAEQEPRKLVYEKYWANIVFYFLQTLQKDFDRD